MSDLSAPHFHNEAEARKYLEALRWPDGPICPQCGTVNHAYATKRPGVYRCAEKGCRKDFSVAIGTIFERSHIPLDKWLLAFRLMCGSKKGMSAHQLHRQLGVTYKSAWFMAHRIRESMRDTNAGPLGGGGKIIEADETFMKDAYGWSKSQGWHVKKGAGGKLYKIVTLVERGGRARSVKVNHLKARDIRGVLRMNANFDSTLVTDEAQYYKKIGREFAAHEAVNHGAGEYGRDDWVNTNTIEGFFSIFKRGMKGVYQHCSEQHLGRYLVEFDFRYSNRAALKIDDAARTLIALKGAEGKRLYYSQASRG